MTALPRLPKMTVQEYLRLVEESPDARYEYVNGRVVMLAGGTLRHMKIGINVINALSDLLNGENCTISNSDIIVRLAEGVYVCPDAAVSCNERDRNEDNILYVSRG